MRNMRNTCLEYGCVKCCLNTEMELSSSDIVRIRGFGFYEDFFIVKKNGNRTQNLRGASFITVSDASSTIIGLKVVG